mmetsp:Transcript_35641/g.79990  ORF Transcript_35641/g.79990 Transcript_35641/m.79990 type:complete len:80 (+) Transcript_35641:896-1135(+)
MACPLGVTAQPSNSSAATKVNDNLGATWLVPQQAHHLPGGIPHAPSCALQYVTPWHDWDVKTCTFASHITLAYPKTPRS